MMSHWSLGVFAAACVVNASQATVLRVAAENDHSAWTFSGSGSLLNDGGAPAAPVVLTIDDDGGPLPAVPVSSVFDAGFTIAHRFSTAIGGGMFVHTYRIDGWFALLAESGAVMLSGNMSDGSFTVIGNALNWYPAATIRAGPGFDSGAVSVEWLGDPSPAYRLFDGLANEIDVEFTLGAINSDWLDVDLDPYTMLPTGAWASEGAFSVQGQIPAPGAPIVVALGGLAAWRRRR